MMKMRPHRPNLLVVVAAALIDADGQVLVQQRPQSGTMPGYWEFPGGKVEAVETPEAALVRELYEELGIEVETNNLSPLGFASAPLGHRHLLFLLYTCHRWSRVPAALHATALKWSVPGKLRLLEMPPADEPLIPLLEQYIMAQPSRLA